MGEQASRSSLRVQSPASRPLLHLKCRTQSRRESQLECWISWMPNLRLGLSQTQFPAGGIQAEGDGPEESSAVFPAVSSYWSVSINWKRKEHEGYPAA